MKKILLILLISACCICAEDRYAKHNNTKVGDKAPISELTTTDGKKLNFKDKVVLVNFFATWCPPCRAEMPALQMLWHQYKKNPNVIIVSIARGEGIDKIKPFRKTNKIELPMAVDPDSKIYKKFAKGYIPRNYIINPRGKIIYQSVGYSVKEFASMTKLLAITIKEAQAKKAAKKLEK